MQKGEWAKIGLLALLVPAVWYVALFGIDLNHHMEGPASSDGSPVSFPTRLTLDVNGIDFPSDLAVDLDTPGYLDVKHHDLDVDFPSSLSVDVSGVDINMGDVDVPDSVTLHHEGFPSLKVFHVGQ